MSKRDNSDTDSSHVVDRRSGHASPDELEARRQRLPEERRSSLYGNDPDVAYEETRKHIVRQTVYRWGLGQDPNDDEAWPDSGWEYVRLEGPSTPDSERDLGEARYKELSGPASGVKCFQLKGSCTGEYLVVQERTPEEIVATLDDVQWAIKNNRAVDPERIPTAWLLFCPVCKHMTQMRESVVRKLRGEPVDSYA